MPGIDQGPTECLAKYHRPDQCVGQQVGTSSEPAPQAHALSADNGIIQCTVHTQKENNGSTLEVQEDFLEGGSSMTEYLAASGEEREREFQGQEMAKVPKQ